MHLRAPVARGAGDARGAPELRPALVEEAGVARSGLMRHDRHGSRSWCQANQRLAACDDDCGPLHRSAPREITAAHVKAAGLSGCWGIMSWAWRWSVVAKATIGSIASGQVWISDDRIDALCTLPVGTGGCR